MITRRAFLGTALWVAGGCSRPSAPGSRFDAAPSPPDAAPRPPDAAAPSPDAAPSVTGPSPFALRLRLDGRRLVAELRNESAKEQTYCYDAFWQPCVLTITDASGKPVGGGDTRGDERGRDPAGPGAFETLAPGGMVELHATTIVHTKGGWYVLSWTYSQFSLNPGVYEVRAVLDSALDHWFDAGRTQRVGGMWLGTLRSNAVRLVLPS
jgi:hypothetical protein